MEVAAALTDKAHSVSVIGIESVPFKQALGEKVGKAIMKVETRSGVGGGGQSHFAGASYVFLQLFEANRVKFYMMNEVSEMVGHHGQVLGILGSFFKIHFIYVKGSYETSRCPRPTAERSRAEQRQGPASRRVRHRCR